MANTSYCALNGFITLGNYQYLSVHLLLPAEKGQKLKAYRLCYSSSERNLNSKEKG